jgi:molecular chaperone GrpE (heat shock protein)
MNQESEDHDEGTIISEFEKGYKYHDRIIRHAKVVVCKST